MISIGSTLLHYKRPEIQKEIVEAAKDREIATQFKEGFGARPDTLSYPSDILELTKAGATSFHMSEERWSNVLSLNTKLKKKDLEELRSGWDLILDIDCKFIEYSKITADLLIKALHYQGVHSVSCKFSGGSGFHIGVPFEAFPERVHQKKTKDLFPDGPRRIATYLREMIKTHLSKKILKVTDIDSIIKKTGKKFNELVKKNQFDPFTILDIDTILISSRHLIRMPYCFNEKTGFISIPLDPKKVLEFNLEDAKSKNVKVSKFKFLDVSNSKSNEAKKLIVQSFDFEVKTEQPQEKKERNFEEITKKVPEEFFAPCIKKGLEGLEDGRKRFVFTMVNFLRCVGWPYEDIEVRLKEWNKKNQEELREIYIISQIRYHKSQKKRVPPPNCSNDQYYKSIGIYTPECDKIKNPLTYTLRRLSYLNKKKPRKKKQ